MARKIMIINTSDLDGEDCVFDDVAQVPPARVALRPGEAHEVCVPDEYDGVHVDALRAPQPEPAPDEPEPDEVEAEEIPEGSEPAEDPAS